MPRQGPQKAIVPFKSLPPVIKIGNQHGYISRYRIISESKNKQSHWSNLYFIPMLPVTPVSGANTYDFDNSTISVVWGDENNRPSYDIFVEFGYSAIELDGTDYFYHGTSATHNYSFLRDSGISGPYTFFKTRIQIESIAKTIDDNLVIFESAATEIEDPVPPIDSYLSLVL